MEDQLLKNGLKAKESTRLKFLDNMTYLSFEPQY